MMRVTLIPGPRISLNLLILLEMPTGTTYVQGLAPDNKSAGFSPPARTIAAEFESMRLP